LTDVKNGGITIRDSILKSSLYIAGYGVTPETDRSVQIDEIINISDCVFILEQPNSWIENFLILKNKRYINYFHLYQDGKQRPAIYDEIVEDILSTAKNLDYSAYLTEGSPSFFDSIAKGLDKKSTLNGIDLFAVAGTSSFDKILFELRVPVELFGIQLYKADNYINHHPQIDKGSILFLTQPGNINSSSVTLNNVDANEILLLQTRLIKNFDANSFWMLIGLSANSLESSQILWGTLDTIHQFFSYMHSGTLVVSSVWKPDFLEGTPPTRISL